MNLSDLQWLSIGWLAEQRVNICFWHIEEALMSPFWIVIFGNQKTCYSIFEIFVRDEILRDDEISQKDFPFTKIFWLSNQLINCMNCKWAHWFKWFNNTLCKRSIRLLGSFINFFYWISSENVRNFIFVFDLLIGVSFVVFF